MYNELLQRFYQKNIELEREKMAKNIIFNKLKEAQSKNADLMKQLKEKDEKVRCSINCFIVGSRQIDLSVVPFGEYGLQYFYNLFQS